MAAVRLPGAAHAVRMLTTRWRSFVVSLSSCSAYLFSNKQFASVQDYILNAAVVHAALMTQTYEFHSQAQSFVWDWVRFLSRIATTVALFLPYLQGTRCCSIVPAQCCALLR